MNLSNKKKEGREKERKSYRRSAISSQQKIKQLGSGLEKQQNVNVLIKGGEG
jgi:hypothetical protein